MTLPNKSIGQLKSIGLLLQDTGPRPCNIYDSPQDSFPVVLNAYVLNPNFMVMHPSLYPLWDHHQVLLRGGGRSVFDLTRAVLRWVNVSFSVFLYRNINAYMKAHIRLRFLTNANTKPILFLGVKWDLTALSRESRRLLYLGYIKNRCPAVLLAFQHSGHTSSVSCPYLKRSAL